MSELNCLCEALRCPKLAEMIYYKLNQYGCITVKAFCLPCGKRRRRWHKEWGRAFGEDAIVQKERASASLIGFRSGI